MEQHYISILVHLDLPNGEAPGIDAEDEALQKISKALDGILGDGASINNFTLSDMDMQGDEIGYVLTYNV